MFNITYHDLRYHCRLYQKVEKLFCTKHLVYKVFPQRQQIHWMKSLYKKNVWTMIIFLQWRHISIILYGNYQFYNLWTLPVFSLVENTAKDFSRFFVIIFFWKKFQVSYKEIFFCHIGLSIYFGRSIFVKYRSELICVSSF